MGLPDLCVRGKFFSLIWFSNKLIETNAGYCEWWDSREPRHKVGFHPLRDSSLWTPPGAPGTGASLAGPGQLQVECEASS